MSDEQLFILLISLIISQSFMNSKMKSNKLVIFMINQKNSNTDWLAW